MRRKAKRKITYHFVSTNFSNGFYFIGSITIQVLYGSDIPVIFPGDIGMSSTPLAISCYSMQWIHAMVGDHMRFSALPYTAFTR